MAINTRWLEENMYALHVQKAHMRHPAARVQAAKRVTTWLQIAKGRALLALLANIQA
jgi:hypothetical protein